jgi:hypothetical protein
MMRDINYAARISELWQRLELPKKLSRQERERMETTISNASGNGAISDGDYRAINRALRTHA